MSCHNDSPPSHLSTLSLHDALPISGPLGPPRPVRVADEGGPLVDADDDEVGRAQLAGPVGGVLAPVVVAGDHRHVLRSEEHTSELQSRLHLVCRLLLEKKKYHIAKV